MNKAIKITHTEYSLDIYRDVTKPGNFGWEISTNDGSVILMDYDSGYQSFNAAEDAGQWEFNAFIEGLKGGSNE